jgi:hypothetical protein
MPAAIPSTNGSCGEMGLPATIENAPNGKQIATNEADDATTIVVTTANEPPKILIFSAEVVGWPAAFRRH